MNRYHMILVCVVVITTMLAIALARPETPLGRGAQHDAYPSMNHGGGADRHASLNLVGWAYGAAQIVLCGVLLTLGLKNGAAEKSHWLPQLTLASIMYLAMFTALMVVYANLGAKSEAFLGMPLSTALLVFGMWPVPVVFTLLYVIHFRRWVYNDADAKRFDALKAGDKKAHKTEADNG